MMRSSSRHVVVVGLLLLGSAALGSAALLRSRFAGVAPVSAEPFCPGGRNPDPNVVMCDNFEDGQFQHRWDIGGHRIWPISEFVLCTDDRFGFHDRCAAWSNKLVFDREWGFYGYDGRRPFPPQSEFYVRWYQYIGDPFVWGTLEDKSVMLHDQANTLVAYVGTNRNQLPAFPDSGPGKPFVANYQDVDTPETGGLYTRVNRFQNQSRNLTLQPGNWYLFEWYIKLNDPGVSNGVTRLWIDDAGKPITTQTLRMEYTDMRWLKTHDIGKQFGVVRLTVYHQRCEIAPNTCPPNGPSALAQSQRWDQIVVSKLPIGPMAVAAPLTDQQHPQ
jgi:hypothetical protein